MIASLGYYNGNMYVSEKLFILYAFVVFIFIIIMEFEDRDRFPPCSVNYIKG